MRKIFEVEKDLFNIYAIRNNEARHEANSLEHAQEMRERFNTDLIARETQQFLSKHGERLARYFRADALRKARNAKADLIKFCTGMASLKANGKCNGTFAWYLLDEVAIYSLGLLESKQQPYANDYGKLVSTISDFYEFYAPPIGLGFDDEETETLSSDYDGTPAVRSFYKNQSVTK